jgi:hypothetical protein
MLVFIQVCYIITKLYANIKLTYKLQRQLTIVGDLSLWLLLVADDTCSKYLKF